MSSRRSGSTKGPAEVVARSCPGSPSSRPAESLAAVESARRATLADLSRLVELRQALLEELWSQRGGRLLAASIHRTDPSGSLGADIADPSRLVVAGSWDGVVVGFGVGRVDEMPGVSAAESRVGVVESLYVEPEARGVGVGEAVMDAVLAWCAEAGCVAADAPALPGNREAKGFFERQGFTARLLVMNRALRPALPAGRDH